MKYNFRVEDASHIYQLMLDMRIRPSNAVHWHMLRAYGNTGDLTGAMDFSEHCRSQLSEVEAAAAAGPLLGADFRCPPTLDSIYARVIRMIRSKRNGGGSEAAIAYIESLFEKNIKTSRLYAALIIEHLKLNHVNDALDIVERLLREPRAQLHEVNSYIEIAYMTVLNHIVMSNNLAYYEKSRIIDCYIQQLVNHQVKALSTFSLYTDYLIQDRNDIYVYINMLNEMSNFFGQDACNIWEVGLVVRDIFLVYCLLIILRKAVHSSFVCCTVGHHPCSHYSNHLHSLLQNLLRKCASRGMHEEAVWILDRMYECEAVQPSFECLALVAQALCARGRHSEGLEMLQVLSFSPPTSLLCCDMLSAAIIQLPSSMMIYFLHAADVFN